MSDLHEVVGEVLRKFLGSERVVCIDPPFEVALFGMELDRVDRVELRLPSCDVLLTGRRYRGRYDVPEIVK
mgnify:FL=1